ncbi:MAG: phosphoribosylanthranilate isomerase [Lachnospiraceae bacterium]|nr:phosphoribosylanthranilate isomerase [Lachnospiraceae bacterium]
MEESMKIKICGIRTAKEAGYINEAKADYAGCVFYEQSKRNVTFESAKEVLKALEPGIKKVAVTVSPDPELVYKIEELGFDILQVHKSLSEEVLTKTKIPIWYACNISTLTEIEKTAEYLAGFPKELTDKIEGIVADAANYGSGKTFDWKISDILGYRKSRRMLKAGAQSPPDDSVQRLLQNRLFILAGGLNPDNVTKGIELFSPDAVDVSSGVEDESGKSRDRIFEFVNEVRKADI